METVFSTNQTDKSGIGGNYPPNFESSTNNFQDDQAFDV